MSPLPNTQTLPAWLPETLFLDVEGRLVKNTAMTVVQSGTSVLAEIFDADGTASANPLPISPQLTPGKAGGADNNGNVQFGAAAGLYDILSGSTYIGTVELTARDSDLLHTHGDETKHGNLTLDGTRLDINPASGDGELRVRGSGFPSMSFWVGTQQWSIWRSNDSTLHIEDTPHSRQHVILTPGATSTLALTEFASRVQVDDAVTTLVATAGAGGYRTRVTGDTSDRAQLLSTGLFFGTGAAAPDTGLVRSAIPTTSQVGIFSEFGTAAVFVPANGGLWSGVPGALDAIGMEVVVGGYMPDTAAGDMVVRAHTGKALRLGAGQVASSLRVTATQVEVVPTLLLDAATPIKLPSGTAGQVLTSDASGNLTLQPGTHFTSAIHNMVAFGHSYAVGGGASVNSDEGFIHKLAAMFGSQLANYAKGGAVATYTEQAGSGIPGGQGTNGSGGWAQVLAALSQNPATWGGLLNAGSPVYPVHTPGEPYTPPPWMPIPFYGNNDLGFLKYAGADPNGTQNLNAFLDAMRTIISRLTAAAVYEDNDATVSYGAGWAAQSSFGVGSGATLHYTTGVGGGAITINVPSDYQAGDVLVLGFAINPANPTGTVTVAVDGSSAALPNAGVISLGAARCNVPRIVAPQTLGVVYRIPASVGLASGAHTITITPGGAAPAGSINFDYWQVEPGADVPPVNCIVPGMVHPYSYAIWGAPLVTDADVTTWDNAYKAMVAAEFPHALYVNLLDVVPRTSQYPYWVSDQAHPSDLGHTYFAAAIYDAVTAQIPTFTSQKVAYQAKDSTRDRLSLIALPNSFTAYGVTGTAWQLVSPVSGGIATPMILALPARPGDLIEVGCNGTWDNSGAQNGCGDVGVMGGFLPSPALSASPTRVAGGTLVVGTQYYGWVSAYNATGETVAEGPVPYPALTTGNQTVNFSVPVPSGATGVRLYRTTNINYPTGTAMVAQVAGSGTVTVTDTGAALTGTAPPSLNQAFPGVVRQVSGNGGSGIGIPGWIAPTGQYAPVAGCAFMFMAQQADCAGGGMSLGLLARLNAAGVTRFISPVFGSTNLQMWAKNHGRQSGFLDRAT